MAMAFMATFLAVVCRTVEAPELLAASKPAAATRVAHAVTCQGKEQVVLTKHLARKYRKSLDATSRIVQAAYKEGTRFGLPPSLLLAIVEQESSMRSEVKNSYGAVGLMQVVPRFHPEKLTGLATPTQLHEPEVNIRVGSWILAEYLLKKKGDVNAAMAKYSGNATDYAQKVTVFQKNLELVKSRAGSECLTSV